MNKKNIAIAMSGLTVLASAAPVFAATNGTVDEIVVQGKYEKRLKELQDGLKEGSIVKIDVKFEGKEVATGVTDPEKLFNLVDAKLDGLGDGDYVDFVTYTNPDKAMIKLSDLEKIEADLKAKVLVKKGTDTEAGAVAIGNPATTGVAIPADLKGSDLLNFTWDKSKEGKEKLTISLNTTESDKYKIGTVGANGLDSGKALSLASSGLDISADPAVQAKVDMETSFVTNMGTGAISGFTFKTPATDTVGKTIRVLNAKEETIDVDSSSSKSAQDLAKKYVFNQSELTTLYNDLEANNEKSQYVETVSGKYQVVLYPEGKRLETKSAGISADVNSPAKLTIKADKIKDLKDYIKDLKNYNNGYSNNIVVAGSDRIETAVELSSKYYNSNDDNALFRDAVDNVVLVGSQSIVDGLVASPLASEKKAPLLLTSKDKLDSATKSEIKRVMDLKSTTGINTSKKVYIAGGVNSISKDVENELKDMGLKVTRLAGDDRYATSLEIADEIGLDNDKAFVVGGTGLADAMSIAPVASQLRDSNGDLDLKDGQATPIVVVDGKAKTLSAEAEDFLDDAQVDIIGGVNSVSKDIANAIDDATGNSPDRVSGDDRQETNAEVIKESDYFEQGKVKNYFVAKDGSTKEDQLVDALAAASIAGNFGLTRNADGKFVNSKGEVLADQNVEVSPAPIVLATDNLSADQHVAVSKSQDDDVNNLVQVGQGIASSVINKLKDLLDM
ncbi:S-layer protein SlpA [Clostridioides sp. ES-S-0145-01]|uniref:S-layer protein SlpA n=1 Tax=Clostridioides sp. ES-S-0145-01 TaxID=2770784 RepID=UPI001D0FC0B5|nr:S-layer protein SlpA [Clostridioides sp. ES-S-0145-01]